jgi:hypothetical protein
MSFKEDQSPEPSGGSMYVVMPCGDDDLEIATGPRTPALDAVLGRPQSPRAERQHDDLPAAPMPPVRVTPIVMRRPERRSAGKATRHAAGSKRRSVETDDGGGEPHEAPRGLGRASDLLPASYYVERALERLMGRAA